MSSVSPGTSPHEEQRRRSYQNLQAARDAAAASRKYDSAATRAKLKSTFSERLPGKTPHEWQVDVAEALLLGLDCTVIAGTGSGKTMPFVMPSFVASDKIYIIISPLNGLEVDQAERFRAMGVSAGVLNGETYTSRLLKDIERGEYTMVLTSPEMTEHPEVHALLANPRFARKLGAFIVDECHCITQWGSGFRVEYTSATLIPVALAEVRVNLSISQFKSFHINLGNDRVNIRQEMRLMKSGSDYAALDFIVKGAQTEEDLPRTVVFVNTIPKCHAAAHRLREVAGPLLHDRIGILHARRGALSRDDAWARFKSGKLRILVATEAAGMGMDIPDITLVVQFGVPESLGVWMQRAGRAARSPSVQARAVMLVEQSVVQRLGAKKNSGGDGGGEDDEDSDFEEEEEKLEERVPEKPKYKKEVEEYLRRWVETEGCRRAIVDAYFENPPHVSHISPALCCDNCNTLMSSLDPPTTSTTTTSQLEDRASFSPPVPPSQTQAPRPEGSTSAAALPLQPCPNTPTKSSVLRPRQSPLRRTDQHLKNVKRHLSEWRLKTRRTIYAGTSLKASNILPDANLKSIASHRRGVKTIEDLRRILKPAWPLLETHGDEVLRLVKKLDEEEDERRRAAVLQARAEKKENTARRHAEAAAAAAEKQAEEEENFWTQSADRDADSESMGQAEGAHPSVVAPPLRQPYYYYYYAPPGPPYPFPLSSAQYVYHYSSVPYFYPGMPAPPSTCTPPSTSMSTAPSTSTSESMSNPTRSPKDSES